MPSTSNSIKISIIMPTYNRAAFILETVESLRCQTFQHWELIIMDDGSEDDTEMIISQVKDERIRFFKAGRIGIISKIRKLGIEKASGEFIAFIDSDDLWDTTKLEQQLGLLEQNKEAGFCVTGGYNFIKPGIPVDYFYRQREGMLSGDLFLSFFKSELAVYIQALLFRRSCMDMTGFKETDHDVDFIIRLAKDFKGIILYEPLLFRRLHDANFSGANWKKNYDKGIKAINENKNVVDPAIVKDAFFRLYVNYGEDCLKKKEPANAIANFFKAWKNKPLSIIPFKKTGKAILQYFYKQSIDD